MVVATTKFRVSASAPPPSTGGGGVGYTPIHTPTPGTGDGGGTTTSGVEYVCASGFKFTNGACVQITGPQYVCSSGYTFMSGNCLQNNLLCPPDYYWNGQVCVQTPTGGAYVPPPVAGEILNVNISPNNTPGATANLIVTFQANSEETNAVYMVRVVVPGVGLDYVSPPTTIPATGQGVITAAVPIPAGYNYNTVTGIVQLIHVVGSSNRTDDTENISIPVTIGTGGGPPVTCNPGYHAENGVCVPDTAPVAGEIINVNISPNNAAGGSVSVITSFRHNAETGAAYFVKLILPSIGISLTSTPESVPAGGQDVVSQTFTIPAGYSSNTINGTVQLVHVIATGVNRTDDIENITVPVGPSDTTPPTAGEITNVNITPNNAPGTAVSVITTFQHNGTETNASYFIHMTLPAAGVNISTTPISVPATGQGVIQATFTVPAGYTFDSITGLVELVHVITTGVNRTDDTENIVVPIQVPGAPPTTCPAGQHLEGNVCVPDVAPVAGEILNVNITPNNVPGGVVNITTTFIHNGSESNAAYFVHLIFPALGINHSSDALTVPSMGQGVIVTNMTVPTTFTGTSIPGTLQLVRKIATGVNRTDDTESLAVPVTQPGQPTVCQSGFTLNSSGVCVATTSGTVPVSGGVIPIAGTAVLNLSGPDVKRGKTFYAHGHRWWGNEAVFVRITINDQRRGEATVIANASGHFRQAITVASSAPTGMANVRALGKSSRKEAVTQIKITK